MEDVSHDQKEAELSPEKRLSPQGVAIALGFYLVLLLGAVWQISRHLPPLVVTAAPPSVTAPSFNPDDLDNHGLKLADSLQGKDLKDPVLLFLQNRLATDTSRWILERKPGEPVKDPDAARLTRDLNALLRDPELDRQEPFRVPAETAQRSRGAASPIPKASLNWLILTATLKPYLDPKVSKYERAGIIEAGPASNRELELLKIVLYFALLGSCAYCGGTFAARAGNTQLAKSWTGWWVLRPFVGVAVALVTYAVSRGGLLGGQGQPAEVNAFAVASLAGLVGLFTQPALQRLRERFNRDDHPFEPRLNERGKPVPDALPTPAKLTSVPPRLTRNAPQRELQISSKELRLPEDARAFANGKPVPSELKGPGSLLVHLPADLVLPDNGLPLEIRDQSGKVFGRLELPIDPGAS